MYSSAIRGIEKTFLRKRENEEKEIGLVKKKSLVDLDEDVEHDKLVNEDEEEEEESPFDKCLNEMIETELEKMQNEETKNEELESEQMKTEDVRVVEETEVVVVVKKSSFFARFSLVCLGCTTSTSVVENPVQGKDV
jgi:hypothetical protein